MEFSPLHNSVISGHFEAVRFLVENGADIHAKGLVSGEKITMMFNDVTVCSIIF